MILKKQWISILCELQNRQNRRLWILFLLIFYRSLKEMISSSKILKNLRFKKS